MDKLTDIRTDDETLRPMPAIFGLRFLEEEEAEIHDVVGCRIAAGTGCDDNGPVVIVLA
jgi:hypothetical protein